MREGDLLWTPGEARIEDAEITAFMRWLDRERNVGVDDYAALWQWSVEHLEDFWAAVWDYFAIKASAPYECVLRKREMPGAEWFPGARLNYAEHIFQHAGDGTGVAIDFASERAPLQSICWRDLELRVQLLATRLRDFGVEPGDRVAAFMPNIPETVVAFLATASIGAVWSSCSTDFGSSSVLDRFTQIEPKVLFGVGGYHYGGKDFDRREELRTIVAALPSLQHVIYLAHLERAADPGIAGAKPWHEVVAGDAPREFAYEQVAFDHPLWIVYSSGTTGLPKAIVHGHGGVTLEMRKVMALTINLRPGKCMFFYTTSGWIMWNVLVSAMIVGARIVLYDGNPASPEIDVVWRLAAEARASILGGSPTYVSMMQKNDVVPRAKYDYSELEGVLLSGSPVTPESMQWLYDNVREDLWVTSQSGGTDIASGFVSGSVILPVYAGEIQARALGVDVQAYNEAGEPVIDEVGELVVVKPMPSMPIYFWNDRGGARYRESYFDTFPGVWRHGDFLKINARGGCFIQGRSDSTLNRYGVRIGTAEIYRAVERIEQVVDALIVNLDLSGGRFFMPLFVALAADAVLDEPLEQRIRDTLKRECSPRHVPDRIYQVDSVPYTLTGKKLEVPVRKILMGMEPDKAVSRDAMGNPGAIDYFVEFARAQRDYRRDA